ncbi:MAG: transcription antitermination factor NusB [Clostridiales bacterium]|nr:transcription antitermination factor NusB [Clostridiales bacterium]
MSRKEARDISFKIIYQNEFQKEDFDNIIAVTLSEQTNMDEETEKYITKVTNGIRENNEIIEEYITKNLKSNWNISRISKLNIAILKIAIFELKYMKEDVPPKVAINEALELVTMYGDLKDKSFINGILAKVFEEVSKEG